MKLWHLSAEERRAYVLADNKLALNAGWDTEILAIELQALIDIGFDVTLTGFSLAEIDLTLDHAQAVSGTVEDQAADLVLELPSGQSQSLAISGCLAGIGCCVVMLGLRTTSRN